MSIFNSTDVLVSKSIEFDLNSTIILFRGAELYAQNPNLIKKDENRVRVDEQDQEHNRQRTLPPISPSTVDYHYHENLPLDL